MTAAVQPSSTTLPTQYPYDPPEVPATAAATDTPAASNTPSTAVPPAAPAAGGASDRPASGSSVDSGIPAASGRPTAGGALAASGSPRESVRPDTDGVQAGATAPDPRATLSQPQSQGGPSLPPEVVDRMSDDDVAAATSLFETSEFTALPDADRALAVGAVADSGGNARVANDLRTLVRDPSFQAMTPPQQNAALADVAVQQSPDFRTLPPRDQRLVTDALAARKPGDTDLPASIQSLISSPQFQDTSGFGPAERTAILSQVRNYPDSRAVENLEKLVGKEWFRDFDLGDSQRAAKTVAFLSQNDQGDQTIISNTLDLFLGADAPYRFDFSETSAFGSVPFSPQDLFRINPDFIAANNNPVDTSARSSESGELRVIGHTFVHEVNHMRNWDRNLSLGTSYGFHEEYRAFYVGAKAQHGRDPTVADVIDRLAVFVTPGGGYAHLAELLAEGGRDARDIAGYLNTALGRDDITVENARAEVTALARLKRDAEDRGLPLPEVLSRPAGVTIGPPGTNNVTNE